MQNQSPKKKLFSALFNEDLGKAKKFLLWALILCLLVSFAAFCCGCSYINKKLGLSDDNLGEEIVEEVIEMKTGLDIDLTPSSPEKAM